ncbi:MAG: folate-binding protein [Gammaproteobacteria bacterium]|nr:folate-binding protein [Gammaproteobacteria bacterium]
MATEPWLEDLARSGRDPHQGATCLEDGLPDRGFCLMDDTALLSVAGPEAESFLQGQLTCDVRDLPGGALRPAAHLNPKGRAIASFLAWHVDGAYLLAFPAALQETVTRRLRMFLLRSKATIGPPEPPLVGLGAWGDAAEAVVRETFAEPPVGPWRATRGDGISLLSLPGQGPRFAFLVPEARAAELAGRLDRAGCAYRPSAAWRLLDIRAGLGWVRAETGEAFLPQMLNYDALDGIGFTKGCYVGQEVVARLHHLGQVKRRAYPASVATASPPEPGTPLHEPGGSGRQGVGTVVDAVAVGDGACELLAVVEKRARETGGLRLGSADGPHVTLRDPPYPLPAPREAARRA